LEFRVLGYAGSKRKKSMNIFELIRSRRSIRKFTGQPVPDETVDRIIEAGTWAPSGLNNQPWRFAVVRDEGLKEKIAPLTHYSRIIREADVLIAVFLDNDASYDRTKDCQAIGACIQNMLLVIHSNGLGAVWLGEILKSKDEVRKIIDAPESHELMAVIALGHPAGQGGKPGRKSLEETVFFRK
jgi:nitroreductase